MISFLAGRVPAKVCSPLSVQPDERAVQNIQPKVSGTKDAVQNGERKTGTVTAVLWQTQYIRQHCVECEQFPLR